ncbi:MAG: DNA topoisomerase I [Candidatus Bathyarchaeota archaeon]|nr:DNA topoisomerase I [Candidatus Bathyarchaeota archaeon]
MLKQLIHSGIILPKYEFKGFKIRFRGDILKLTHEQEEMAVAWVKKLGTPYVEDSKFVKNFFKDFCNALAIEPTINPSDFDFSEIVKWVEDEKAAKEMMTKEEKKKLAEERKKKREKNKEKYGYAIVNGKKVEVAAYQAEPAGIFMGRGKHPLRGSWKPPVKYEDITLNLSPDAPKPKGNWKEIVWQSELMWIARWDDPLRGEKKYVWLADTAPIKQEREKDKFDHAKKLGTRIGKLRSHIQENLVSEDPRRRKLATVSYLIDALKIRVGDEKGDDEADTVGATTLRAKHVKFLDNGSVLFDFLGKDSIRFKKSINPPPEVLNNLKEFVKSNNQSIFNGVRSDTVSEFLSEVVEDVSSKGFRTYHATEAVKKYLSHVKASQDMLEWEKKEIIRLANLQAAILLNHKKAIPKNFNKTLEKRIARLGELKKKKITPKRKETIRKSQKRIEIIKKTKEFNLNTSLKSYIDPRIIYRWSKKVGYNWRDYYPKSLERKFEWIENTS